MFLFGEIRIAGVDFSFLIHPAEDGLPFGTLREKPSMDGHEVVEIGAVGEVVVEGGGHILLGILGVAHDKDGPYFLLFFHAQLISYPWPLRYLLLKVYLFLHIVLII